MNYVPSDIGYTPKVMNGHLLYLAKNLLTVVQRLTDLEKRLRQLEQPPLKPKP
jgi:hypothetical protein